MSSTRPPIVPESSARSKVEPTVVIGPEITSYNQDHAAVARALLTALRPGPPGSRWQPDVVLTYEEVADSWAALQVSSRTVFVELSDVDVEGKVAAMSRHASQCREHPHTRSPEALRALAVLRGAQSGCRGAEAFGCLRWVVRLRPGLGV
ncbi:hypothetical protein D5S18_06960 [Nocardia panacis]|uniref:Uncharacterized protein n=1 Tax=Nocardia panacis TaxID=2340916 RepID=A0A3A4KFT4_9NOCA|nr:hypothetical protein [Nocardia panacis]RJO77999.1 hypothetical protein D5S18_06960 [Nocardia panacis]